VKRSRLLQEIRDTVRGLVRAGISNKQTLKRLDALTLPLSGSFHRVRSARLGRDSGSAKRFRCRPKHQRITRPKMGDRRKASEWAVPQASRRHSSKRNRLTRVMPIWPVQPQVSCAHSQFGSAMQSPVISSPMRRYATPPCHGNKMPLNNVNRGRKPVDRSVPEPAHLVTKNLVAT